MKGQFKLKFINCPNLCIICHDYTAVNQSKEHILGKSDTLCKAEAGSKVALAHPIPHIFISNFKQIWNIYD
jgi:hypothetical protein